MANKNSGWSDWVKTLDTYSPDLEYADAIGEALEDFEKSLLSDNTEIWSIRVIPESRTITKGFLTDVKLQDTFNEDAEQIEPFFRLLFINRALSKSRSKPKSANATKLQITASALQSIVSQLHISPAFLFSLSRFYLPQGRDFKRYQNANGDKFWSQWYFLPFRVQIPCTDKQRNHTTSTAGRNQMNPFHYLHLPDEKVDIRGSHIAVFLHGRSTPYATTAVIFNFMSGRRPKIIEELQHRILNGFEHLNVSVSPMLIHLVLMTSVVRWWNNALYSVSEQLLAYERRLQEEIKPDELANAIYDDISKALHAIAAHIHRYGSELHSLEETGDEIARSSAIKDDPLSPSLAGIEYLKSRLRATSEFAREQEKKTQNVLALLFNRMQISNDRLMVVNGNAIHEIMLAAREEARFSRAIAERSQTLTEETRKDGVSMKTIAVITMFFLPATSFAALLAMPFFATNPYLNDVNKIWIWFLLTIPSTGAAFLLYKHWRKRDERRQRDEEASTRNIEMDTSISLISSSRR